MKGATLFALCLCLALATASAEPVQQSAQRALPRIAHGKRFFALMQRFIAAAKAGNMPLTKQIQQQLFEITKPAGVGRRKTLQDGPATNACPALTNSVIIPVAPTTSGAQVAGPEPNNPLPSIRVNTLEPCAEFGCRTNFALARQSDGTIVCRNITAASRVAVEDFAYFQVYDYDGFWNTDGNNVLGGAYTGNRITNDNAITSKRGELGLKSSLKSTTNTRIQPNIFLGFVDDSELAGEVNAGAKLSRKAGDVGVVEFTAALPKVSAKGTFDGVVPGTVVKDREGEPEDSNIVFRSNNPALFGYFGKKR